MIIIMIVVVVVVVVVVTVIEVGLAVVVISYTNPLTKDKCVRVCVWVYLYKTNTVFSSCARNL